MFVVNVDWFFISHRLPIALEARRQGYKVHIVTRFTDKLDELQLHGFIVHPLTLDRAGVGLLNAWRAATQLWRVFSAVQPDVVHLITIKPILLGGIVARFAGVPAVVVAVSGLGHVFVANGLMAAARRWLVVAMYRLALGHSNLKVILQNYHDRATLAAVVNLKNDQVEMIRGSGVDLTQYCALPLPLGQPVVILASRLIADKGVREYVEAARLLKQRRVSARFALVGTIDPANPTSLTEDELGQWAREGIVEVWGHRSDMPRVLAAAHVVVLPSYYGEGLPKVLIEAASCGRAIVTSDHPGCRDAIVPGITGLLVPPRNPTTLAEAIEVLINDPERCQTMGAAGRVFAEELFDVQQVVKAHLRIYQELLGEI